MWDTLATIETTQAWQYSPLVTGKLFRLRHTSDSTRPTDLRAVAAQVFQDNVEMFFDSRRITFKPEVEIFEFNQPGEFLTRAIAIKRLDSLNDNWTIEIEALDAVFIPESNLHLDFSKARNAIALGII